MDAPDVCKFAVPKESMVYLFIERGLAFREEQRVVA